MKKLLITPLIVALISACSHTQAKPVSQHWIPVPDGNLIHLAPTSPPHVIVDTVPIKPAVKKPRIPRIKTASKYVVIIPQPSVKPRRAPKITEAVPSVRAVKKYALGRIGATQFACLDNLWTRESHWNYKAGNPNSGPYGIPQALPGSKMSTFGSDWRTNPLTQVKWGLHYIKVRYGSACKAWYYWGSHRWY